MLSDALLRVKRDNYKEECLWKVRNSVLEKEEDTSRKFHIFHIEKMKNKRWRSLEQIKATNQKESKRILEEEKAMKELRELESEIEYVSPFIPRSPSMNVAKVKSVKRKVVAKDWSDFAYERYQNMLEELDVTLRLKNEPEPEPEPVIEEAYHMPIPKIIIQPNTESESDYEDELLPVERKKKNTKRNLPKNIDFGRIKYLKNLRIVKAKKATNKL